MFPELIKDPGFIKLVKSYFGEDVKIVLNELPFDSVTRMDLDIPQSMVIMIFKTSQGYMEATKNLEEFYEIMSPLKRGLHEIFDIECVNVEEVIII